MKNLKQTKKQTKKKTGGISYKTRKHKHLVLFKFLEPKRKKLTCNKSSGI